MSNVICVYCGVSVYVRVMDNGNCYCSECKEEFQEYTEEDAERDAERYADSMDGDHDSAMTSAGFGTDEDYGYYGDE